MNQTQTNEDEHRIYLTAKGLALAAPMPTVPAVSSLDQKALQLFGYRMHSATGPELMQWSLSMESAATNARRNGLDAVAAVTYDFAIYLLSERVRSALGDDHTPLFTPEKIDALLMDWD